MSIDRDVLAGMMAAWEAGADMDSGPFDVDSFDHELLNVTEPFLTAVVEDTRLQLQLWLVRLDGQDAALSYAAAGFLQGLAIGYAYAREDPDA